MKLALTLAVIVVAAAFADAAQAEPALATADVNMRSGPSTTYGVVTLIPGGSTVDVGKCADQWCPVRWNGRSGYAIARNFDNGRRPSPAPAPAVVEEYEEPTVVYGPPPVYVAPPPYYYWGPYRGWGWHRRW